MDSRFPSKWTESENREVSSPNGDYTTKNSVTDFCLNKVAGLQMDGERRGKAMYFYSKESSRIEDNYKIYSHLGYEGTCAFCGDYFKSSSPKAKYCSQRCQNDAYMKRRKERKALEKQKVCVMCEKQFTAKKKDAMYCRDACKQKAYRKRKRVTNFSLANFSQT